MGGPNKMPPPPIFWLITLAMTWGLPRRACDPHKGVENSQENGYLTWFQRLRGIHLLKSCTLQKAEQALHASWDPWGTPHVGISKCSKCCTISFKNKLGHNLHFFQVLQEITHGSHLNIKNNFKKRIIGIMKKSIFLSILSLTTPWWNIQPIPLENPPYRKGRQVPTIGVEVWRRWEPNRTRKQSRSRAVDVAVYIKKKKFQFKFISELHVMTISTDSK